MLLSVILPCLDLLRCGCWTGGVEGCGVSVEECAHSLDLASSVPASQQTIKHAWERKEAVLCTAGFDVMSELPSYRLSDLWLLFPVGKQYPLALFRTV